MKKIFLPIVFAAFAIAGQAQVLKNGILNGYKAGEVLEKAVYTEGCAPNIEVWSAAFTRNAQANVTSPLTGEPLTYSGYPESGPSIVWGSGFAEGARGRRNSVYTMTEGREFRSAKTLYLSFLINFSQVSAKDMYEFASLNARSEGGGNRGTLYVMRDGTDKIRFGVDLLGEVARDTKSYDLNSTHLVVLKLDYNKQSASLFVNPVLGGAEPEANAVATPGTDNSLKHAIRAFSIRNWNGYKGNVGNFRLSKSWSAVAESAAVAQTK